MKTCSKRIAIGSAAFLSLAIVGSVGAQITSSQEAVDSQPTPAQRPISSHYATEGHSKGGADTSNMNLPAKCERASGIIGMEVKNQSGERLGKVKDVVFDVSSERVAYVVMEVPGKRLLSEKYVAVPISAFKSSGDERELVLNSDKSKLESAQGFAKDNWPSANNPSWGAEPFWQSDNAKPMPDNSTPPDYNTLPDYGTPNTPLRPDKGSPDNIQPKSINP